MSGAPGLFDLLGEWELGPPVATLVAAGAAYALGVRSVRRWPAWRSAAWGAGLVVVLVALQSGVHAWGERLQSVHMLQHLLLCLVAAPLLCAGAPVTLALRAAHGPGRQRLARALRHPVARVGGHPATGCAALVVAMLGIHLTPLYELAARDPFVHEAEHVALLGAGALFWAPLVGADPAPHRAGAFGRLGWPLLAMGPMGALGAILLTATPRFPHYEHTALAAGVSPAADERLAAVIMWVGGGLVLTAAVLVLAGSALWQEEQRMRRREAVSAP
jgi:putative membrane protein